LGPWIFDTFLWPFFVQTLNTFKNRWYRAFNLDRRGCKKSFLFNSIYPSQQMWNTFEKGSINRAFSFDRRLIKLPNLFQSIEFSLSTFDSLDPKSLLFNWIYFGQQLWNTFEKGTINRAFRFDRRLIKLPNLFQSVEFSLATFDSLDPKSLLFNWIYFGQQLWNTFEKGAIK